jgi:hypothetical protein
MEIETENARIEVTEMDAGELFRRLRQGLVQYIGRMKRISGGCGESMANGDITAECGS